MVSRVRGLVGCNTWWALWHKDELRAVCGGEGGQVREQSQDLSYDISVHQNTVPLFGSSLHGAYPLLGPIEPTASQERII